MKIWTSVILLALALITTIPANAFDSMIEYENYSKEKAGFDYVGHVFDNYDLCKDKDKIIWPWDWGDLTNTYIPLYQGEETNANPEATGGIISEVLIAATVRLATYVGLIAAGFASGGITVLVAALLAGGEIVVMLDICNNAYVIQPHEFVNRDILNLKCQKVGEGDYNFKSADLDSIKSIPILRDNLSALSANGKDIVPFTASDIPFYYTCDPAYDYETQKGLTNESRMGHNYGYVGKGSPLCQGVLKDVIAANPKFHSKIGTIAFEYVAGYAKMLPGRKYGEPCNGNDKTETMFLKAGESKFNFYSWYAYYRMAPMSGKIQICVAAPHTLLPIRVGCSQIAPPSESEAVSAFARDYLSKSRCTYFIEGRRDLFALADALAPNDSSGRNKDYIKGFLKSELHLSSTMVGCMQDLLYRIFWNDGRGYELGQKSFFERVRNGLRGIVLAVLTLYVAIIGIRFMIDPELTHNRGEIMMLVLKFALVTYFAVGNPWYSFQGDNKSGLLTLFMEAPSQITNIIVRAYEQNDPIGFCSYKMGDKELFSEEEVDQSMLRGAVENTYGFKGVKMSVWDLVDCKIANYLNFGTCQYTLSGFITFLFSGPTAVFSGGLGIALAIVSFLYLFLLLLIVFRFVHLFILSLFMITIFIFTSPIFILFALFQVTFPIFKQWFVMLLGYMLYPAFNFLFIIFMLATLDMVNYGNLMENTPEGTRPTIDSVRALCAKAKDPSAFCITVDMLGLDNPCRGTPAAITEKYFTKWELLGMNFWLLKAEIVNIYFQHLVKLALFALLFYTLLGAMVDFMAVVLGILLPGQGEGAINMLNALGGLFSALPKAAGAMYNKVTTGKFKNTGQKKQSIADVISGVRRR